MRKFCRKLVVVPVLALAVSLSLAPAALARVDTSSSAAYSDAQNWTWTHCSLGGSSVCIGVAGSSLQLYNPYAQAGQIQWKTWTTFYTSPYSGSTTCYATVMYAAFGPYSGSGYATPVQWYSYGTRGC